MSLLRYVYFHIVRKPVKNLILVAVMTIVFFCELIGLCLYQVAYEGKKEAFRYNGCAFYISEIDMNKELLEQLKQIKHVESIDNYTWYNTVYPTGLENVKDHEGSEVKDTGKYRDEMALIAHTDTQVDSWFWWEKSVSVTEGEFPSLHNKGVMVESRFAQQNHLKLGDNIEFEIEGKKCNFNLCGIYKADAQFIINEENDIGESVYYYSPYNRVYVNYEYLAEQMNIDMYHNSDWRVYVDSYESVKQVEQELHRVLGQEISIENSATDYLDGAPQIVTVMGNYAHLILMYVTIIGAIFLLIILSYFVVQYRYEAGIMMAMGFKKVKIAAIYFISVFFMMFAATWMAVGVYSLTSEQIVTAVDDNIVEPFESTIMEGTGPVEIKNLDENFSITVDTGVVLQVDSILKMGCILTVFCLIGSGIPVFIVIRTRPSFLLQKQGEGN